MSIFKSISKALTAADAAYETAKVTYKLRQENEELIQQHELVKKALSDKAKRVNECNNKIKELQLELDKAKSERYKTIIECDNNIEHARQTAKLELNLYEDENK